MNDAALAHKYKKKYPRIKNVLDRFAAVVACAQRAIRADKNVELECRVKMQNSDSSTITRNTIDGIVRILNEVDTWSSVTNWNESQDYFYHVSNCGQVRQTLHTNTQTFTTTTSICKKQKLSACDATSEHIKGNGFNLRINAAVEQTLLPTSVPKIITPEHVRIKQRKTFATPRWNYDITLVWQGATKTEAETNQNTQNPAYEFELECNNMTYLRDENAYTIATSMLLKLTDLLECDNLLYLNT